MTLRFPLPPSGDVPAVNCPPYQDIATLCANLRMTERRLTARIDQGRLPAPRAIGDQQRWKWSEVWTAFMGQVYFIESAGLIKIGFTLDPEQRLAALRNVIPTPIRVLLVVQGTLEYEQALHARFDHLRAHGEWFRCAADIEALIAKLAAE